MPCDMYVGETTGDFALNEAHDAQKRAEEAMKVANTSTDILCRVLRGMSPEQLAAMDPDIQKWFVERSK